MATNGWTGLPYLVRQLEEVLFRQNPNKVLFYFPSSFLALSKTN
jgi:hypothetical protein